LYKMDCMEEADNQYKLALEADPNNAVFIVITEISCYKWGAKKKRKTVSACIEYRSNNAAAHNNYGVLLEGIGNTDEARNNINLHLKQTKTFRSTL